MAIVYNSPAEVPIDHMTRKIIPVSEELYDGCSINELVEKVTSGNGDLNTAYIDIYTYYEDVRVTINYNRLENDYEFGLRCKEYQNKIYKKHRPLSEKQKAAKEKAKLLKEQKKAEERAKKLQQYEALKKELGL